MTYPARKIFGQLIYLMVLSACIFLLLTPFTHAQMSNFTPLVGIPGITNAGDTSLPGYINAIYKLVIVLAALFGVMKIALAGVKYSMSDIVTHKEDAKEDIKGVLLGLAILLVPFIVLYTINPDLVNLNVLQNAEQVNLKSSGLNSNNIISPSNPDGTSVNPNGTINAPNGIGNTRTVTELKTCTYDAVAQAGCSPEIPCPTASYDSSACVAECATLGGMFLETSSRSSRCSYLKEVAPTVNISDIPGA